jgi:hypothetical protein
MGELHFIGLFGDERQKMRTCLPPMVLKEDL